MNSLPHLEDSRQDNDHDEPEFDTFLQWERASRDTIDVKKIYIDMAGDLVTGIVLSQLVYWYLPDKQGKQKLRVQKGGQKWIAKARHDWWNECRVSPKQVDRALRILAKKGFIKVAVYRFKGAPTKHIRIIHSAFIKAWGAQLAAPMVNPFLPNGENPISLKGEIQLTQTVKSLTETTAKTTTEGDKPLALPAPKPTPAEVDGAIYGTPEEAPITSDEAKRILDLPPHLRNTTLDNMQSLPLIDAYAEGINAPYIATRADKVNALRAIVAGYTPDDMRATVKAKRKPDKTYALSWAITDLAEVKSKASTPAKVIGGILDMSDIAPDDPNFYKIQTERMSKLWEAQNERRSA